MEAVNLKVSEPSKLTLIVISSMSNNTRFRELEAMFAILYADNVESGLSLSLECNPALFIINGHPDDADLLPRFKKNYRTSRIPVLTIIEEQQMQNELLLTYAGATDFMSSASGEQELVFRVRMLLLQRAYLHKRYVDFDPVVQSPNGNESFLLHIKSVIEKNLDNTLFGVRELALEVGVSTPQLYRRLVALTGFSPNGYIRHIRLKHAVTLLSGGAGNVGEVANRVGFASQSYFAKCFKAAHHHNPKKVMGILCMLLFIFSSTFVEAQLGRKRYLIQIELLSGSKFKGDLSALNDSSIRMVKYRPMADTVFYVRDIKTISIRRRGAGGRGYLVGTAIGGGLGGAIGYASYTPPSCDGFCLDFGPGLSAIAGAVVGGITGGLVGLAVGSGYTEYLLHGNQSLYDALRKKIFEQSRTRRQKRLAASLTTG